MSRLLKNEIKLYAEMQEYVIKACSGAVSVWEWMYI